MRIAFLGKGGSGKTTLSAGFIRYMLSKNKFVLAIDADHNVHLQDLLELEGQAKNLSGHFDSIKEYLKGERTDLQGSTMIDSTPPSAKSRFIFPKIDDQLISEYALKKANLALLTVGSYEESDAGKTCYHGKLGVLSNILHHMLDGKNDLIVADATAGVDNLGTSLYFAYDLTLFVVEPTKRSIDVYLNFEKLAQSFGIKTMVVVNKAEDGDEEFVTKHIPVEKIVGFVSRSIHMRDVDQGDQLAMERFVKENCDLFEKIYLELMKTDKDWDKYYRNLLNAHKALALEWYDAYYNQPISSQLDPEFNYSKVIENE